VNKGKKENNNTKSSSIMNDPTPEENKKYGSKTHKN